MFVNGKHYGKVVDNIFTKTEESTMFSSSDLCTEVSSCPTRPGALVIGDLIDSMLAIPITTSSASSTITLASNFTTAPGPSLHVIPPQLILTPHHPAILLLFLSASNNSTSPIPTAGQSLD